VEKEMKMAAKTAILALLDYHAWVNERLLGMAEGLAERDLLQDRGYGRGSVFATLLHILRTDARWRAGLTTGQRGPEIADEEFPQLADLRQGFQDEAAAWHTLASSLGEASLDEDVEFTDSRGSLSLPRWKIIHHILLHGMQHQAELAMALTTLGHSPGDLDLIYYRH
jgi:uncharacterized damage-inducible protein DinB